MSTRYLLALALLLVTRLASAECECLRDPNAVAAAEKLDDASRIQRYEELVEHHKCVVDYRMSLAQLKEGAGHFSEAKQVWCAFEEVELPGDAPEKDNGKGPWCGQGGALASAQQTLEKIKTNCQALKRDAFVTLGEDAFELLHAGGKDLTLSFGTGNNSVPLSKTEEVRVPSAGKKTFYVTGLCTTGPQPVEIDVAVGPVALEPDQIRLPACPSPTTSPRSAVVAFVIGAEAAIHERLGADASLGLSVRPVPFLDVSAFGLFALRGGGPGFSVGVPIRVSRDWTLAPQARLLFIFPWEPASSGPPDDSSMSTGMGMDLKTSYEPGRHSAFLLGGFQYFASAPQEYSRWVVLLGAGLRIGVW